MLEENFVPLDPVNYFQIGADCNRLDSASRPALHAGVASISIRVPVPPSGSYRGRSGLHGNSNPSCQRFPRKPDVPRKCDQQDRRAPRDIQPPAISHSAAAARAWSPGLEHPLGPHLRHRTYRLSGLTAYAGMHRTEGGAGDTATGRRAGGTSREPQPPAGLTRGPRAGGRHSERGVRPGSADQGRV